MIKPTQESLNLLRKISETVYTWHHHHHILYDIAKTYPDNQFLNYVEIGCFAGASSCLMLHRPNTRVIAIDLGDFPSEQIMSNTSSNNIHNNPFHYIQGNSHDPVVLKSLMDITKVIDILFIDGSHLYEDVVKDFKDYSIFVAMGGYIVFDDYNDQGENEVFPAVRKAVNHLIESIIGYEIIGTLDNTIGARGFPAGNIEGNCFVLRKLS